MHRVDDGIEDNCQNRTEMKAEMKQPPQVPMPADKHHSKKFSCKENYPIGLQNNLCTRKNMWENKGSKATENEQKGEGGTKHLQFR